MRYLILILSLFFVVNPLQYASAGEIALTFDDAPMPGNRYMSGESKTAKIISALKKHEVEDAYFFVTTQYLDDDGGKRLEAYADAGYKLANHSHKHLSANKVTSNEFLRDFYTSHLLAKPFKGYVKFHRFPYLHYGDTQQKRVEILAGLSELGYQIGYVTVDNFDWYLNAKLLDAKKLSKKIDYKRLGQLYVDMLWEAIIFYDAIAKASIGRSPKHVLLLHENEMAALFLGDLIERIRSEGWKLISPTEAYLDPISQEHSATMTFTKQGRIASIAQAKGKEESVLRHPAENTEFLDKKLQELKVFN